MKVRLKAIAKTVERWYAVAKNLGREDEEDAERLFAMLARTLCDLFVRKM